MRKPLALLVLCGAALLLTPARADAHPLGNFTVNHYTGITLHTDRVELHAVVDSAEIPTLQEPVTDADRECTALRDATSVTVGGQAVSLALRSGTLEFPPGEAGLATTRLACRLEAPARLDRATAVSVRNSFRADRIGWHEMTAVGDGIALMDSPLPTASISDELREYPDDLLADPLDVRGVDLRVRPGSSAAVAGAPLEQAGPLDSVLGTATSAFTDLAGTKDLTPAVGLLALLLSLLLGASHAALPGHGKTVIAAYLAGKHGTAKDAVVVGTTVTITHTAGVLVLGLLISASSVLAGESVLSWLGVVSGLLVAGIGVALLVSALRHRAVARVASPIREPALVGAGAPAAHGHGHGLGHGHGHRHGIGRSGLVGMGIAGGLVPSPSALVVLLGAVALGRTWFGVLLVLGYGLGMAATLTAVGMLLLRLRDRLETAQRVDRLRQRLGTLTALMPTLTATLVLAVGLALAARAALG